MEQATAYAMLAAGGCALDADVAADVSAEPTEVEPTPPATAAVEPSPG